MPHVYGDTDKKKCFYLICAFTDHPSPLLNTESVKGELMFEFTDRYVFFRKEGLISDQLAACFFVKCSDLFHHAIVSCSTNKSSRCDVDTFGMCQVEVGKMSKKDPKN